MTKPNLEHQAAKREWGDVYADVMAKAERGTLPPVGHPPLSNAGAAEIIAKQHTSYATLLVHLALSSGAELFHNHRRVPHIRLPPPPTTKSPKLQVWRLDQPVVRVWLSALYFRHFGTAPQKRVLSVTLSTLKGMALYDAPMAHSGRPRHPIRGM